MGISYTVKNSPYPEVILRPRLEAENEGKAKEVEGHVVIAQESGTGGMGKKQLLKSII